MDNNQELFDLLDSQSKVLVGYLLKRIEVLEKEKVLTPNLYKALVKEQVYEFFRNLKLLIQIGRVEFKSNKSKENENGR